MAKSTTKRNDPAKVALEAVEDALKIDLGGPEEDMAPVEEPLPPAPAPAKQAKAPSRARQPQPKPPAPPQEPIGRENAFDTDRAEQPSAPEKKSRLAPRRAPGRGSPNPRPAPESPRPSNRAERSKSAANDDRRTASSLLFSMQQRPSRVPFWTCLGLSALWAIVAGYFFVGAYGGESSVPLADAIQSPTFVLSALAVALPVFFLWSLAYMLWRTAEMRLASQSMAEIALRLAEPESPANPHFEH